jgi:predicted dehydrogenase
MAKMVCAADPDVRVTLIVDPRGKQAVEAAVSAGLPGASDIQVLPDIQSLIDRADQVDALMIGTPCNLHATAATQVAVMRLPIFLEKPVAISWEQLEALDEAYKGREESVVVSFPLRLTDHVQKAAEILRTGRLGTINQVQAINNVPYGGVYFGQWYRDYQKTGGLWLQKATHDLDYINHLVAAASAGARPVSITAMHSRTVYGGTLPEGLLCSECDRVVACPESPQNLAQRGSDGGMLNYAVPSIHSDHLCAFSKSIKNQDAGTAIIMYSDGVHAAYSQNFLTRGSAGRRGATITGYHATLQFDWQSDLITVIDHHRDNVDRIKVESQGAHGGGDSALARDFVDVIRGRGVSHSPLDQGILSAAMCMAAKEAAEFGMTQKLLQYGTRRTDSTNIRPRGTVEPMGTDRPASPRLTTFTPVTRKAASDSVST